jgi:hypothetical protein
MKESKEDHPDETGEIDPVSHVPRRHHRMLDRRVLVSEGVYGTAELMTADDLDLGKSGTPTHEQEMPEE